VVQHGAEIPRRNSLSCFFNRSYLARSCGDRQLLDRNWPRNLSASTLRGDRRAGQRAANDGAGRDSGCWRVIVDMRHASRFFLAPTARGSTGGDSPGAAANYDYVLVPAGSPASSWAPLHRRPLTDPRFLDLPRGDRPATGARLSCFSGEDIFPEWPRLLYDFRNAAINRTLESRKPVPASRRADGIVRPRQSDAAAPREENGADPLRASRSSTTWAAARRSLPAQVTTLHARASILLSVLVDRIRQHVHVPESRDVPDLAGCRCSYRKPGWSLRIVVLRYEVGVFAQRRRAAADERPVFPSQPRTAARVIRRRRTRFLVSETGRHRRLHRAEQAPTAIRRRPPFGTSPI